MISPNQTNFQMNSEQEQDKAIVDLNRWIALILSKWYLVAASGIIGVILAFVVNYISTPVYQVSSKIVKQEEKKSANLPIDIPLGDMEMTKINMEYEQSFFMSRSLLTQVIHDLGMDVTYFKEDGLKRRELYKSGPFVLLYDSASLQVPYGVRLDIEKKGRDSYAINVNMGSFGRVEEGEIDWTPYFENKVFKFNEVSSVQGFNFRIDLHPEYSWETEEKYFVVLKSPYSLVKDIREKVTLKVLGDKTSDISLLELASKGAIPRKESDLLNAIYNQGQKINIVDKNEKDLKTIAFIEEQLGVISDSMRTMASKMHSLKITNKELAGGSTQVFEKIYALDEERSKYEHAIDYSEYLQDYIKNRKGEEITTPNVFGVEDESLTGWVQQYVELRIQYDTKSVDWIANSPIYDMERTEIKNKLISFEETILGNLVNMKTTYQFRLDEVKKKIGTFMSSAESLLSKEKVFSDYRRLYEINEKLYTILLEKKAEASINRASATSDYKQLEAPEVSEKPISPKKALNLMIGLIIGMICPLGIFYVRVIFDNKIRTKEDVEALTNIPVLGIIGLASKNNELVVTNSSKSPVAEGFRSVRANMKYMTRNKDKFVLLCTSTISGEGKTFCSANTAASFAQLGKKVLLIGADVRKPKLKHYLGYKIGKGLTDYLADTCESYSTVQETNVPNLHVIPSGSIPPNPAELLSGDRMKMLIDDMKEAFDIIVIDTAPIGIVSDAKNLFTFADIIFLMVKQKHTLRSMVKDAEALFAGQENLQKVNIILNGVDFSDRSYYYSSGYSYTYGGSYYGEDEKSEKEQKKNFLAKLFS